MTVPPTLPTGRELNIPATEGDDVDTNVVRIAATPLTATPYDPGKDRENVRGWMAKALFWMIAAIIVGLLVLMTADVVKVADLEKFVAGLLTPILTLFGAVMGFYFGERAGAGRAGNGNGNGG